MHMNWGFFSTCNRQLYWKRDAGKYSFLWVLRNFLRAPLLWKTSCELNLKREFYKKWRTDILNIHFEGECIFENHLKKVDTDLNSIFQLHHRYFCGISLFWGILLKYFVSFIILKKNFGSVLRCSSQWLCLCIF